MQHALSQVPTGLNEQQVQHAVNRELNDVMQDVANRVSQQRRIAGQTPQGHIQTEFVIEELPDESTVVQSNSEATPQRMLPSAGHHNTGPTSAPGQVQYEHAYPKSAHNEIQSTKSQRPAMAGQPSGGPQYATILAGHPQVSNNPLSQAYMPQTSHPSMANHVAARPQGQLEVASAQMQQIAGVASQGQLEAPPSSSTAYPATGRELVYQSRDLDRGTPRR